MFIKDLFLYKVDRDEYHHTLLSFYVKTVK
jgi:hypothetical protein